MAWYDALIRRKLNPAQPHIGNRTESSREQTYSYQKAYEEIEIVNRGVNMIVDDAAEIPVMVGESTKGNSVVKGVKKAKVEKLLNFEPNLYQDVNTFKRNLFTDYILDGNIFIYFDGSWLYHLPANKMIIHTSEKTYIDHYTFNNDITYKPGEIIHIKENSFYSIYRGVSRLKPALRTMMLVNNMRKFQDNFFKNGAIPGLVIKSPNTLSEKIKERMLVAWSSKYNPSSGGRSPLILDGGLEVEDISKINFRDLDFQTAITDNEKIILKALGVPPILLDSGNNANLRPNLRLYYLETVLPIVKKLNFGYQRYFGFEIKEDLVDVPALQPELKDLAAYHTTLTNGGITYPNESRVALGYERDPSPESDELRIPQNIAGSATDPSQGGRPSTEED